MGTFRGHTLTVVICLMIAAAFTVFWFALSNALPFGAAYELRAQVPSAQTLSGNASVRIAGLRVGNVTSVERAADGALLGLEIDEEHAPLPEDSRIEVRLRTLVGESYVEIYPGRSETELPEGALVPASQTGSFVAVDEILDSLRGETRERAREFFRGFGGALDGRGEELNELVEGAAGTISGASPLMRVLARDRERVARLVDRFGEVSGEIGDRGEAVRRLARGMRVTVTSVARRDEALRAVLDELPPMLEQLRSTAGTLEAVTPSTAPVLSDLAGAVNELDPAVRLLQPAADEGRRLLGEVDRSVAPLRRTLAEVRGLAGPAEEALPEIGKTLCQANPALEYLAPYAEDIAKHVGRLGYWANYYDATAWAGRLHALIGEQSPSGFYDETTSNALATLLDSGLFGELRVRGYNPYPEAGTAGDSSVGQGWNILDNGLDYPRIEAEC